MAEKHDAIKKWGGFALLLLCYGALCLLYLSPRETIVNIDFWYHLSLGMGQRVTELPTLVNGLYPAGYPALLAGAVRMGIDVLRAGQLLSVLGGGLAVGALYLWGAQLTKSALLPFLGCLLLMANENFMIFATQEGNDMLSAGLQIGAMTLLLMGARGDDKGASPSSTLYFALAGAALGLGYLVRYTALILLPLFVGCLCVVFLRVRNLRSPRWLLRSIGWLLVPFLLVTAIQWIPSLITTGDPFFNTQAKNVWFGVYGQSNWVANWDNVPADIGLFEVMALDPPLFFQHWLRQIQSAMTTNALWPLPLHIGWIGAALLYAIDGRQRPANRLLLLGALTLTVCITALAWLDKRFMLVPLWLQAGLLLYLAYRLSALLPGRDWAKRLMAAALLMGGIGLLSDSWIQWWNGAQRTAPVAVHAFLRTAGMDEPEKVATNDQYLHAVDLPQRTRYTQLYETLPSPETVDALTEQLKQLDANYLVLNDDHGLGNYSAVKDELVSAKALIPLSLQEQQRIFCIDPCAAAAVNEVSYSFGDMHLTNYAIANRDGKIGLFLVWTAASPLEASYKVSLRIVAADGTQISQLDGIPQQWTAPTTTWPVDEPIVDFYHWDLGEMAEVEQLVAQYNGCADCQVVLLVYNEASGEPLNAVDANGAELGPLVPLGPLRH